MIKCIRFLTIFLTFLNTSSSWTTIECNYKNSGNYHALKSIYFCSVNNNPNILTRESAQINSINGEHMASKLYDDVIGFDVRGQTVHSFPRGLHTYFKNLKVIYIESCGLKEIHQAELKSFPNLVYFFLGSNSIEVIEEGLFDNNPNLEAIGFYESKIVHIDPKVFDKLTKLRYFWFSQTSCVKKDIWDSKEKVQEVLKLVKNQCTSADYRIQRDAMDQLEAELKTLNSGEIKAKIQDFESTFNNSIFSKFRPLRNRMQSLKNIISVNTERPSVDLVSKVNLEALSVPNIDAVCQSFNETVASEFGQVKTLLSDLKSGKKDTLATVTENLRVVDDRLSKFDDKMELKLTNFDEKLGKIEEKLENNFGSFQDFLAEFEAMNAEKMEREFTNTRHKISINIDEKIKGIEKRIVSNIEEKLGKLIEEKLSIILEARPSN